MRLSTLSIAIAALLAPIASANAYAAECVPVSCRAMAVKMSASWSAR